MNQRSFFNGVTNGWKDIIQELMDNLQQHNMDYCVIGGLAVNAYVEPVVSLDLDIVVVAEDHNIERFPHSINLGSADSDVRIQIQTDPRYQEFIQWRGSKRQKDLADIMRIIESYPHLESELPEQVIKEIRRAEQ